jgi:hypothetical protein
MEKNDTPMLQMILVELTETLLGVSGENIMLINTGRGRIHQGGQKTIPCIT